MEVKTKRTSGSWKFERVLRDCGHNKTIAERGETRGLLCDFKIVQDGRHIGWWSQYSPNGGTDAKGFRYWLRDKLNEPVQNGETYSHPVGSRNRAEFERVLESNIHRIPTDAEIEERQAESRRKDEEEETRQKESVRIHRLKETAPELLTALIRITEKVERAIRLQYSGRKSLPKDWSELYRLVNESRAAIAKAGGAA